MLLRICHGWRMPISSCGNGSAAGLPNTGAGDREQVAAGEWRQLRDREEIRRQALSAKLQEDRRQRHPLAGGPKGHTCHAANGKLLSGSCQIGPLTAVSKHVFAWGGRP
jgi:hypothetical protein